MYFMDHDVYSTWVPLNELQGRVIVERIVDSDIGLEIFVHLSKTDSKFRLLFDPYIAYKNMDESYRAKTFDRNGGFDSSLNIVRNSSWLEWLHVESQGYYIENNITHYAIITDADCIDVLSQFEPEIEALS